MSTQPAQFTTLIIPEKKKQTTNWKATVEKYLYHWPLFVIGLVITVALAIAYLQFARPVYDVQASLIILDEKKTPDQQSALSEIDVIGTSKLLENEIEVLKSKRLITQVVDDLQLGIVYKEKADLKVKDLYKSSPVELTLLSPGSIPLGELTIVIKDEKSFFVKSAEGKLQEFNFNIRLKNNFGSWKLNATNRLPEYKGKTIQITILDPDLLALQYQQNISVSTPNKLATTVVLSIQDEVAQRGKDILNQLMLNYAVAGKQEEGRETKRTLDFLDQRLASLTRELTAAEQGIEGFKSSRGITDISSESKINLENMQVNDANLNEVNVQLSVVEGIERYINSPQNSGKIPATLGIVDPALSSLIEKLSDLQLQRDKLLATTPETNPDFEPINRQIASTRAAIKENVRNIKSGLLNTRAKLQSFNAGLESSIKNIPTQERQYISIKRQQAIKENLYNYLLQKREEVALSYESSISNDRIVDRAYAGPAKTPRKAVAFAVALMLGICLPAGLIYGRDVLNGTVTDRKEINDATDVPVIAEIPFFKSKEAIVIKNNRVNAVSEQFRALRTNLHYLYGEKETGRVTLLTSSISGEGKSFISSNLGVALARSDRKTILLELDLRKPKISETFNLNREHPGIGDFLAGAAPLSDIIRKSASTKNLDIISSGTVSINPAELLEKNLLKELLHHLRSVYDDIIIDSPPLHLVPDAMIISRLSDATLYIIKQGFTAKSELSFLKELNDKKQLPNLSIIFNGIERLRYGYGYDYDTSYYSHRKSGVLNSMFGDFSKRF